MTACRALRSAALAVLLVLPLCAHGDGVSNDPFGPVLAQLAGNLAAEAADLRRRIDAAAPCDDPSLQSALEHDRAEADVLEADAETASTEERAASQQLRDLGADKAAKQAALEGAARERAAQHTDFIAREEAYAHAIDLLQSGIQVTQQAMAQNMQVGGGTLLAIRNAVAPLLAAPSAAKAAPAALGALPVEPAADPGLLLAMATTGQSQSQQPQQIQSFLPADTPPVTEDGGGLEMLAPSFLQVSGTENQAIMQVLSSLLQTFEAHREELARNEAVQQQQSGSIQSALGAMLSQGQAAAQNKENSRAEAAGRAADSRARLARDRTLLQSDKLVSTALGRGCSAVAENRRQRAEVLARLLSKLPAPQKHPGDGSSEKPPAGSPGKPPAATAGLEVVVAAREAAPEARRAALSFLQVRSEGPAAPAVQGLLSELLTKLTAPGASPRGAQWCGTELPRAAEGLARGKKQQSLLQDTAVRLESSAAALDRAATELEARDALVQRLASAQAREYEEEAAVLTAELQQHGVALRAVRDGMTALESAGGAPVELRDVAAGLEDLQELSQKSAAAIKVSAEQLAGAVNAVRSSLAESVQSKRREQREVAQKASTAHRDADTNAEQIKLADKYVKALTPACAQSTAANTAQAQEVEAVRQAARIVDAAES